ncbi:hypothetical protein OAA06_00460 [bacterium]|nr:hypothetical protein [bacterium]
MEYLIPVLGIGIMVLAGYFSIRNILKKKSDFGYAISDIKEQIRGVSENPEKLLGKDKEMTAEQKKSLEQLKNLFDDTNK